MIKAAHFAVLSALAFSCLAEDSGAEPTDARGIEFFEKKIRPVLVKHCYECHSADSKDIGGDLWLDTREGIRRGGESGHAVVPGNPAESMLLNAIRFEDFEMPPENQLAESVIADFEKWIQMGAPDPRDGESGATRRANSLANAREFWSFQPIQEHAPPRVRDESWPRTAIDRFILAKLEEKDLTPVVDTEPRVLVRRVYFDLIGLPPTPEQVDEFVKNPTVEALSELIDRLLDSPQFGERWGRHWLDVARYGESTGMERNFTYPYAWRFRDYVIKSFNDDKPFDRFITEQIAGDLMPAENIEQRNEQIIGTGLLAIGTKSLNSNNREQFVMDLVDEQIDVTTQAFMGFTVACARCHDHKFDPIPNEEYYSLAGIFRSTDTYYGTGGQTGNRQQGRLLGLTSNGVARVGGGRNDGAGKAGENKRLAQQLKTLQRRLPQLRKQAKNNDVAKRKLSEVEESIARLRRRLQRLTQNKATTDSEPSADDENPVLVMGVLDSSNPADTELRIRGEADDRGELMPRGFLSVLSPRAAPKIDPRHSGRMEYAQWLTSRENPLTARVAVNRVWMHLFGRGIVTTVNNFGATGAEPTHPELLDYLATRFVDNGWSVKQLIRDLMNSRVYQLSSGENEQAESIDPDNDLLWKMNQRRLDAEAIRDAILLTSGTLDLEPAEGSIVETIGNGDVGRNLRPEQFATKTDKRSVYLPIVRGVVPEVLQVFDFPDPSIIFGQREVTTVPSQALFMLNSPMVIDQAEKFARRVLSDSTLDDSGRVERAYRLALARRPTDTERNAALAYLAEAADTLKQDSEKPSDSTTKAWTTLCQTLYACAEFRYVE